MAHVNTVAAISGVGSAAVAQQMTKEDPSILKYVVYDFGQYSMYLGDVVTLCGLAVALVSVYVAIKRVNRLASKRG